jgi:hypothetical protein
MLMGSALQYRTARFAEGIPSLDLEAVQARHSVALLGV